MRRRSTIPSCAAAKRQKNKVIAKNTPKPSSHSRTSGFIQVRSRRIYPKIDILLAIWLKAFREARRLVGGGGAAPRDREPSANSAFDSCRRCPLGVKTGQYLKTAPAGHAKAASPWRLSPGWVAGEHLTGSTDSTPRGTRGSKPDYFLAFSPSSTSRRRASFRNQSARAS